MRHSEVASRKLAEADPKARQLVDQVQSVLARDPLSLDALKHSLIRLLEYLASREGRTDQNCRAVDSFFTHDDRWVQRNLPDGFPRWTSLVSIMPTINSIEIAPT